MVEGAGGLRLLLEATESLGIGRGLRGQDLDRHFPPEPLVARAVHLPHAPRAQRSQNLVGAEARARCEGGPSGRGAGGCHLPTPVCVETGGSTRNVMRTRPSRISSPSASGARRGDPLGPAGRSRSCSPGPRGWPGRPPPRSGRGAARRSATRTRRLPRPGVPARSPLPGARSRDRPGRAAGGCHAPSGQRGVGDLRRLSAEGVAEAVDRPDEAGPARLVAERRPKLADDARQVRLRHDRPRPEPVADLGLGQRPRPALQEQLQELERLRTEGDLLRPAPELPAPDVDREVTEMKDHVPPVASRNVPGSCRGLPDLRHRPSMKQDAGCAWPSDSPEGVAHEGVDRCRVWSSWVCWGNGPSRVRRASRGRCVPGPAQEQPGRLRRRPGHPGRPSAPGRARLSSGLHRFHRSLRSDPPGRPRRSGRDRAEPPAAPLLLRRGRTATLRKSRRPRLHAARKPRRLRLQPLVPRGVRHQPVEGRGRDHPRVAACPRPRREPTPEPGHHGPSHGALHALILEAEDGGRSPALELGVIDWTQPGAQFHRYLRDWWRWATASA